MKKRHETLNVSNESRTDDRIAVKNSYHGSDNCANCKHLGFFGSGTFTFCEKLWKRVRSNNVCEKFEEKL